ncbi:hypothetical protein TNCV_926551 [Trichonephila clavipes]|nr:hypothetical protein TNCV_926551 [Trichonephila clavipes]
MAFIPLHVDSPRTRRFNPFATGVSYMHPTETPFIGRQAVQCTVPSGRSSGRSGAYVTHPSLQYFSLISTAHRREKVNRNKAGYEFKATRHSWSFSIWCLNSTHHRNIWVPITQAL